MPPLQPGDVVVSPMMGAYTTVTSSRFNGIAETPIVVCQGNRGAANRDPEHDTGLQ
jgi:ornithine decarboxylase